MTFTRDINLRPWREEKRQLDQQQFQALSILALIVGLVLSAALWYSTQTSIAKKQAENTFIEQQTEKLNLQIKEVADLRKRREELLQRMDVVHKLEAKRPESAAIFEHLALSVNSGVYLTGMKKRNHSLSLQGMAYPVQAVASFMRRLGQQAIFAEPELNSLLTDQNTNYNSFDLVLPVISNLKQQGANSD